MFGILYCNPKKELLRGPWVGPLPCPFCEALRSGVGFPTIHNGGLLEVSEHAETLHCACIAFSQPSAKVGIWSSCLHSPLRSSTLDYRISLSLVLELGALLLVTFAAASHPARHLPPPAACIDLPQADHSTTARPSLSHKPKPDHGSFRRPLG